MTVAHDVALQAVELARRSGATDADAWLSDGGKFALTVRDGQVEELVETGSRTLGLRVFLDQRTALVYSSDLESPAVAQLAEQAVELAKLTDPDPCVGLPDGPFSSDGAALDLYDPDVFAPDPRSLIDLLRRGEAIALAADPRITTSGGSVFSREDRTVAVANSRGFAGSYRGSSCSLMVDVIADDADHKKREGWWEMSDRRFAALDDIEIFGRNAADRATRQLGARKVSTQAVPVVWSPEVATWLLQTLADAASGVARYRGLSFLIDREGDQIGSPLVTIIDDGTLPGRLGSRPFDDEGTLSRRTPLFEEGRFAGFLYDAYTARKAGETSTANAGRWTNPLSGTMTVVAPTNLCLLPGVTSPPATSPVALPASGSKTVSLPTRSPKSTSPAASKRCSPTSTPSATTPASSAPPPPPPSASPR